MMVLLDFAFPLLAFFLMIMSFDVKSGVPEEGFAVKYCGVMLKVIFKILKNVL